MEQFSIWQWLIILVMFILVFIPSSTVMKKAGYSRAWALLYFIPLVNLITLWIFAFSKWPALRGKEPLP